MSSTGTSSTSYDQILSYHNLVVKMNGNGKFWKVVESSFFPCFTSVKWTFHNFPKLSRTFPFPYIFIPKAERLYLYTKEAELQAVIIKPRPPICQKTIENRKKYVNFKGNFGLYREIQV